METWRHGEVGAALEQGIGLATDHEALYEYTVDPVDGKDRRTLRDYSFEQQAAIIEDAYRVTVLGAAPKNYLGFDGDIYSAELWQLYKLFMHEFAQWNEEKLQESNSTSHLEDN